MFIIIFKGELSFLTFAPCKCCREQFLLPVFDQKEKQFVCKECLKTYEDGKFRIRIGE